jgi:hypothetical protein
MVGGELACIPSTPSEVVMPNPGFEIEEIVDSLALISDIIFRRLHCMECNQCEPCGAVFMGALKVLREAGNLKQIEGGSARGAE